MQNDGLDDEEEDERSDQGYSHFNENESNDTFTISVFDRNMKLAQKPGSRNIGHGAVVWEASVVAESIRT